MRLLKLILACCALLATAQAAHAQGPDLTIALDDGRAEANAADLLAYTVSLANVGDRDSAGVVITETVPNDTTFDATASSPSWFCSGNGSGSSCSMFVGDVTFGSPVRTFVFAVRVDDPLAPGVQTITNTVTVADDGTNGPDLNPADNTAIDIDVIPSGTGPDLVVTVDDGQVEANAADLLTYTVSLANNGDRDSAGVVITETVPNDTTFDATASSGSWLCSGNGPGSSCSMFVGDVTFGSPVQTFVFAVRVDDPLAPGVQSITNTVAVADDGANGPDLNPANNTATDVDVVPSGTGPDLVVTVDDGQSEANAGDLLAYTVSLANDGDRDSAGVVITEIVPADTMFDATASSGSWLCSGNGPGSSCSMFVGDVTFGSPVQTFVFAVRVDDPLAPGVQTITNTVTVADDGSNGPDLNPTDNTATDVDVVPSGTGPDLVVTVDDGQSEANAADLARLHRLGLPIAVTGIPLAS